MTDQEGAFSRRRAPFFDGLANPPALGYTKPKTIDRGRRHDRLSIHPKGGRALGHIGAAGESALRPGADSRSGEIRKELGHSHRRGETGRSKKIEKLRLGEKSCSRAAGKFYPYAVDEHVLSSGRVPLDGGEHGAGTSKGHRDGGVSLFQRPARGGVSGGRALSQKQRSRGPDCPRA